MINPEILIKGNITLQEYNYFNASKRLSSSGMTFHKCLYDGIDKIVK
jgi:hypothetical protein